jgi:hypothetical protein
MRLGRAVYQDTTSYFVPVAGVEFEITSRDAMVLALGCASSTPKPEIGRGDRIRTCDILLPKQARYRTAPLPDLGYFIKRWWARQDSNPRPSRYERPALTN